MNFFLRWGYAIVAFIIIVLSTGVWIIYGDTYESIEGRKHIHKPISFAKDIAPLKTHTLVYFGQVGCEYTCVPRMKEIFKIYTKVVEKVGDENLDVLLINLDKSVSMEESKTFAKSFHPSFYGVSLEKEQLKNTLRMFYSHFASSLKDMDDASLLYSIHKDSNGGFYLNNIYTDIPFNVDLITQDLIGELK